MICFLYELFQRKVNHCTSGPNCHKKKKKKKKGNIEKVQMLSWKAYKHCLAPAMITSFQNTAHLVHLVLKKIL